MATSLSSRCVRASGNKDWERGRTYFQAGRVSIMETGSHWIFADVQGSLDDPYEVGIYWYDDDTDSLDVYCSCPRFDDTDSCKHVTATILAIDAQGLGERVPGNGPRYLARAPEEDDDEEDDYEVDYSAPSSIAAKRKPQTKQATNKGSSTKRDDYDWEVRLARLAWSPGNNNSPSKRQPHVSRSPFDEIWYVLDVNAASSHERPRIDLRQRSRKKNGDLGTLRYLRLPKYRISDLDSPIDREIFDLVMGTAVNVGGYSIDWRPYDLTDFAAAPAVLDALLPRLCATGRFCWTRPGDHRNPQRLRWDDGPPWNLHWKMEENADERRWEITGELRRESETAHVSSPLLYIDRRFAVFPDRIARVADDDGPWAQLLHAEPLRVPVEQEREFVERMIELPFSAKVDWPERLKWTEERPVPNPQLRIPRPDGNKKGDLECRLFFQYGEREAPFAGGSPHWFDNTSRRKVYRDQDAERQAREQLLNAGARMPDHGSAYPPETHFLPPQAMPLIVKQLSDAGWHIEAEGRILRSSTASSITISTDMDWFDLTGEFDFDGVQADVPTILAAVRRGDRYIRLDDGSEGLLPEEWLDRLRQLAELGRSEKDRIRFLPSQATLLDALLNAQDSKSVTFDRDFQLFRKRLHSFRGVHPRKEPRTFRGELRPYQRLGLGWLTFLDDLGLGGCLADDMGLGKTVQILALLDKRRRPVRRSKSTPPSAAPRTSLVVVPRSLVFNWMEESQRFAPRLKVLNYTGFERKDSLSSWSDHDLVVTTYGTLRRDIADIRAVELDYVILDEAQAIKNASSQAAKACRLLNARRRLAVTGTPVENHLGELWSLFEFLNPGMLGRNKHFRNLFSSSKGVISTNEKTEDLALLRRAIQPFLLRRTKKEVLTELPDKTEQTLFCELNPSERKIYNELRDHYRRSLADRVGTMGMEKSKVYVLEALLRLRQAACHPGLLDKNRRDGMSSKVETLLEQITEIVDEGHKVLVFSQFTTLLGIVRRQLDRTQTDYEYLDGRTTKRQAKVARFQEDPDCRVFLISLKAGGYGLNLTAADYVYILDPWWNPAAEAQAVDRAHRMGQERPVFAYRLITRDTVEEKILQLQDQKRDLASAIMAADGGVIQKLTPEDLQLLLN